MDMLADLRRRGRGEGRQQPPPGQGPSIDEAELVQRKMAVEVSSEDRTNIKQAIDDILRRHDNDFFQTDRSAGLGNIRDGDAGVEHDDHMLEDLRRHANEHRPETCPCNGEYLVLANIERDSCVPSHFTPITC